MADATRTIALKWNDPQTVFMETDARYVDFEGAVRSGKTTPLIWKIVFLCLNYPGLHAMLSRWTDDTLNAQLKPRFYELCPKEWLGVWKSDQQYQEFKNGSRVYIRSLKSADDAARYGKFAGLTLGVIGVDQPEELPKDIYLALKARLSQAGFPQQLLLTPNPPGHDHWLAEEFPEENTKPDHLYIRTAVYDNEEWIGRKYIQSLEDTYPPGSVLHRRYIHGMRGLTSEGEPVYGGIFKRRLHVNEDLKVDPRQPLLEAWDFGHKHPAVLWSQLTPEGAWHVFGEMMGDQQYIDDFVPQVLMRRAQLFPDWQGDIQSCCDPSGADHNSQGLRHSAIDVLADFKIYPRFVKNANRLDRRDWAIQQIARYMLRFTKKGPALQIHPRCKTLIDGFEGGYVFDDKQHSWQVMPNIRRPKKDGLYDHLQNDAEYTMLNFISGIPPGMIKTREEKRELRRMQRDFDPDDAPRAGRSAVGRAGY